VNLTYFDPVTGRDRDVTGDTPLPTQVAGVAFTPIGAHSDGAVITSATTLTPPAGAGKVLIQALGANVRFTLDGTAPAAGKGFQLRVGEPPLLIGVGAGTTLKVIEETATADLQYQWGQ
jgi:hypothetical protein